MKKSFMKRSIMSVIQDWATSANRMPLVLQGARQVGKTSLLKEFGRIAFDRTCYFNFEADPALASVFEGSLSPHDLRPRLEAVAGAAITPRTLVIFDEVQSCRRALTSLKYFCEEAPDLPIVAAGSLLGVSLRPSDSGWPVGKVKTLTLFPMDFPEFLRAMGDERLLSIIEEAWSENRPLEALFHERLMRRVREYLVIGGMPAVVGIARDAGDFGADAWSQVREAQAGLLGNSLADMARYAPPREAVRVEACFRSLPAQLGKPNQKFMYRVVKSGATAARFEYAIDWLVHAGLVIPVRRVSTAERPLRIYEEDGAFKAFLMDTGLFGAMAGFRPADILGETHTRSFGGLTETFVAQSLRARFPELHYWESDGRAEVDFVVEDASGRILAIEAKSGASVKAKSLGVFMERHKDARAIRISGKNFGTPGAIRSVPLYAAGFVE